MATILASSLNNYISVANAYTQQKPYVMFTISNPNSVVITIENAENEDGYRKEISGSSSATLSSSSFRTRTGSTALSLMECLKLNPIFYNITLASANAVKAYIDTSVKYLITVSGSGISVGGTYQSYTVTPLPKATVMLGCSINGETVNIPLEKYSDEQTVKFDLTAPFAHMNFTKPISVNVAAYTVYNSVANTVSVPYSSFVVLPTTLKKFQSVDYNQYQNTSAAKKHFLTNLEERPYNYGEHYAVSFLSTYSNVTLKKSFYTNGGVFMESQSTYMFREKNGIRYDFIDLIDLDAVEGRHGRQVGYILVTAMNGNTEISYPLKLVVQPKCSGNHEIFFMNELGGVDSFSFTDKQDDTYSIGEQMTFKRNPINGYGDTYMIEEVYQKQTDETHSLTKYSVSAEVARWLNELAKSKHAFLYVSPTDPKFKTIIIDKCSITVSSDAEEFDVNVEYHESDDKLAI